jgi:hypothetical protein
MSPPSPTEISAACRLLFGSGVVITPEFLAGLNPSELRATFRRRAMELHPDRANLLGVDAGLMGEMFKDVKQAYDQLTWLVEAGVRVELKETGHYWQPDQTADNKTKAPPDDPLWDREVDETEEKDLKRDHYWEAGMPSCRLLFGQFLYYTGLISWRMLIDAIVWQRSMRPPFGRIATMWNYFEEDTIREILTGKRPGELFGDSAARQGYINDFQKRAVIGLQKWLQRPIGEYFQDIGLLEDEEVAYLIRLMKKHNSRLRTDLG